AGPVGPAGAGTSGTQEWARAPGEAPAPTEEEQRRLEREAKLLEASYAPERIGRISVILCAVALAVFTFSLLTVCLGGLAAQPADAAAPHGTATTPASGAAGAGGGTEASGVAKHDAKKGGKDNEHAGVTAISFFGGTMMSMGFCMFGFSPLCAVMGLMLGIHSVLRSRHTRLWGALGAGLNALLLLPPIIVSLVVLMHG
ncbi:MAG: hypothetical protein ACREJ2_17660, partial [Planctomycetota bacterium]